MSLGRRLLVAPLLLALAPSFPAQAGANQMHGVRVTEYAEGHPLCPVRRIVIGNVAVRGGHCYVLVVVRDGEGAFLAFADPPVRIPRGQLVGLDTPEGETLRARILYRVPMPEQVSGQMLLIAPNTVQLVRLRQEDEEVSIGNSQEGLQVTRALRSHLTVIMTGSPPPGMSVTFAVHF